MGPKIQKRIEKQKNVERNIFASLVKYEREALRPLCNLNRKSLNLS